jgi:hypothetical protein
MKRLNLENKIFGKLKIIERAKTIKKQMFSLWFRITIRKL